MYKFRSVRTLGYFPYTGSGTPRKKYDFLKFFDLAYQKIGKNCSAILLPDLSWVRIPPFIGVIKIRIMKLELLPMKNSANAIVENARQ